MAETEIETMRGTQIEERDHPKMNLTGVGREKSGSETGTGKETSETGIATETDAGIGTKID